MPTHNLPDTELGESHYNAKCRIRCTKTIDHLQSQLDVLLGQLNTNRKG